MRMIVPGWGSCRTTRSPAEAADAPVAMAMAAQAESRMVFMTIFLLDCVYSRRILQQPV